MANTYTRLHIQFVFAVKFRRHLINPIWKDELYKYMTGIIQNNKHKMLQINGVEDHVHILVGFHPDQAMSDLMKQVKQDSTKWINKNKLANGRFAWQSGFGAFSYSKEHVPNVIRYIERQEEHHKKTTFKEEYKRYLKHNEIDHDDRYIFKDPE